MKNFYLDKNILSNNYLSERNSYYHTNFYNKEILIITQIIFNQK